MTPEEHYRGAEELLERANKHNTNAALLVAAAQVHATLALVPRDVQQRAAGIGVTDPET